MPAGVAKALATPDVPSTALRFVTTNAHLDARARPGQYPVLIFSRLQRPALPVHRTARGPEPARQHTLGLANERNVGNVFVMDTRGLTASGKDDLYDHLPPYWPVEVREADSYYDFAFDPKLALQAAYRYAVGQGKLHAWPNFEAAWYGNKHVRGTFLLDVGAHAIQRDVAFTDLPGLPQIYEVAPLWKRRTNTHEYRASKLRSPRSNRYRPEAAPACV
jgi:hypothetical protein